MKIVLVTAKILLVLFLFYPGQTHIATAASPVLLNSSDNIQSIVNANPAGTTYQLSAGVFRMQSVTPKNGDVFKGTLGANNSRLTVLTGARLLENFTREGNYWVASGQSQQGQTHPQVNDCVATFTRCGYPEDFFINNVPLKHVDSLSAVGAGKYYFDYINDKIYFFDNPASKTVETSVARAAFAGSGTNVTIQDLVVEKYAIPAQMGAIGDQYPGQGWTVSNVEAKLNHGIGIKVSTQGKILNSHVRDNGQMGISGSSQTGQAVDILVEGNEISNNGHYAGINWGWEGGGFKFVLTNRLVVRNNNSHHNKGPGMWTDIENINTVYENNLVTDNQGPGIFHEISYAAIIRNNKIYRNGTVSGGWIWDAGILVAGSSDVEIHDNDIRDNPDGISLVQQNRSGPNGFYALKNAWVHHNTVVLMHHGSADHLSGAVQDMNDNAIFTSRNNRFDNNTYYLGSNAGYFAWNNNVINDQVWKNFNNDVHGQFFHNVEPPPTGGSELTGDINKDCIVNTLDWSLMNTKWLTNDQTADINKDGLVNSIDFSLMNTNWFKRC